VAAPGGPRGAVGFRAESAVAEYLRGQGFAIVAQNLRLGRSELDIVARRAELIAVVEVRTRGPTAWTSGFGSITRSKRERIRRAGQRLWRERYQRDPSALMLRFDAACVSFEGEHTRVDYVPAAF
jgi:putative endonuclease